MAQIGTDLLPGRLRQVDVKAEHFERQAQSAERERDSWERKYEVIPLLAYSVRAMSYPGSRKPWKSSERVRQNWTTSLVAWISSNRLTLPTCLLCHLRSRRMKSHSSIHISDIHLLRLLISVKFETDAVDAVPFISYPRLARPHITGKRSLLGVSNFSPLKTCYEMFRKYVE